MRKPSSVIVGIDYTKTVDTQGLYSSVDDLEGTTYIFDANFIHLVRYGLSTFCTSEMTTEQLNLFEEYIDAVNQITLFTPITSALDKELVDISLCREDIGVIVCGNAELHTYADCGTDINL